MWHAKPSGGYGFNSQEAKDNMDEIYSLLYDTWTLEAVSGMIGNLMAESGLNPWRWQNDSVSLTAQDKGYGLPQFTPAYGYIQNYGVGTPGFSPNLSVTSITSGATAEDGKAQIIVINEDRAGKYIDRRSYCTYANLSNTYPFSSFKQVNDLWIATVGWLFNYEFPSSEYRTEQAARLRYANSVIAYEYLAGHPPIPPRPTTTRKLPLYMMLRNLRRVM